MTELGRVWNDDEKSPFLADHKQLMDHSRCRGVAWVSREENESERSFAALERGRLLYSSFSSTLSRMRYKQNPVKQLYYVNSHIVVKVMARGPEMTYWEGKGVE